MDIKIITKRLRRFNHCSMFTPHLYPGKSPLFISTGIKYIRDSLDGFSLIDTILCLQCDRDIGKIFFQRWIYKQQPHDLSWILQCYDNEKLILSKKIEYSKFSLPKIEIWLINKNLLLQGSINMSNRERNPRKSEEVYKGKMCCRTCKIPGTNKAL